MFLVSLNSELLTSIISKCRFQPEMVCNDRNIRKKFLWCGAVMSTKTFVWQWALFSRSSKLQGKQKSSE
jgi:hypothetical protein